MCVHQILLILYQLLEPDDVGHDFPIFSFLIDTANLVIPPSLASYTALASHPSGLLSEGLEQRLKTGIRFGNLVAKNAIRLFHLYFRHIVDCKSLHYVLFLTLIDLYLFFNIPHPIIQMRTIIGYDVLRRHRLNLKLIISKN